MNALKHGLTMPIELTPWAAALNDIEALLASEGLAAEARHELARRIVEYERNAAFQRQLFFGQAINLAPLDGKSAAIQADVQEIAGLEDDPATLLVAQPLARRFVKLHERIAGGQRRAAVREGSDALKSADRYHRRAANQLIKELKRIGDQ